jgi:GxxExxY protein
VDKPVPIIRENLVAREIVEASFKIHSQLGPGLLESVYEQVLAYELIQRGLLVRRQHPIPVYYDQIKMNTGFRADLLVEGCVIVEVKSVRELAPVHFKQLLTYLRLSEMKLGLMLNFGEYLMRRGIKRITNGLYDEEWVPLQEAG